MEDMGRPGPGAAEGLHALPRPVAVVVGGGGVLGAAHVGFGYPLEHRRFVPDLIVGTSVGALTGAIAAAHPDRAAPADRAGRAAVADRGVGDPVHRGGDGPGHRRSGTARPRGPGVRATGQRRHSGCLATGGARWPDPRRRWPGRLCAGPGSRRGWGSHSQRLISTASATAGRFLDRLCIRGPGLYCADRVDRPTSSVSEDSS